MFVGQGGGKDEERLKRPWIGRAGQLLRDTIRQLRQKKLLGIALSNSVRCHPTDDLGTRLKDRKPTQEELDWCLPHLCRDIAKLKPVVVMALGASTAGAFGFEGPVSEMRKQSKLTYFKGHEAHVFMTYHPSGLLQSGMKNVEEFRADILSAYKLALNNGQTT